MPGLCIDEQIVPVIKLGLLKESKEIAIEVSLKVEDKPKIVNLIDFKLNVEQKLELIEVVVAVNIKESLKNEIGILFIVNLVEDLERVNLV